MLKFGIEMDLDDILKKLCNRYEYYSQWLNNYNKSQEIAQFIQIQLEYTNWMIDTLRKLSEYLNSTEVAYIFSDIENKNQYIESAFPMIPEYDYSIIESSSALTTADASALYACIEATNFSKSQNSRKYVEEQESKYYELESVYDRQNKVFKLLIQLNSTNTIERYNQAAKSFAEYKINPTKRISAANGIRNLLYGIQGDLYEKARKWKNENMTWEEMAKRLAKGGINSVEFKEVINQQKEFSKLIEILSNILKDHEGKLLHNLEAVWIRSLDFIYVILSVINI